jgi:hypothetical protein
MTKLVLAGLILASSSCSLISCSAPPSIKVSPTNISFTSAGNYNSPSRQILEISHIGSGALKWKLTSSAPWLYVNPSDGTSVDASELVDVTIDTAGMEVGNYSAVITVDAPQAINSPQSIPVNLRISYSNSPVPPKGIQLLAPNNGSIGCKVKPASFYWSPCPEATRYQIDLARDPEFKQLTVTATTTTPGYEYSGTLDYSTNYFWRVKALQVNGLPIPTDWSATFSMQTKPAPAPPTK